MCLSLGQWLPMFRRTTCIHLSKRQAVLTQRQFWWPHWYCAISGHSVTFTWVAVELLTVSGREMDSVRAAGRPASLYKWAVSTTWQVITSNKCLSSIPAVGTRVNSWFGISNQVICACRKYWWLAVHMKTFRQVTWYDRVVLAYHSDVVLPEYDAASMGRHFPTFRMDLVL